MARATKETPKFKKGQHVVYPIQGVGVISHIETITFNEKATPYYIIVLPEADMTVKVPVPRAVELGIRLVVSKAEAEASLEELEKTSIIPTSDWKQRYQQHLDLLRKGDIRSIAMVVHSLHTRKKVKELPILEQKLYSSAVRLFIDELSLALEVDQEAAEAIIFDRMQASEEEEDDLSLEDNEEFADL